MEIFIWTTNMLIFTMVHLIVSETIKASRTENPTPNGYHLPVVTVILHDKTMD